MGESMLNCGVLITVGAGREAECVYLRGTYMLERDAPMPGVPWTTFWLVIANSPRKCPIISGLISIATNSLPEC